MRSDPAAETDRSVRLEALHERLVGTVGDLVTGEDWKRSLEFAARFRSRSFNGTLPIFNNTLLIAVQKHAAFWEHRVPDPTPTYVAGFKQWQALGRHMIKGQSGYQILAPVTARFASTTPEASGSWRRFGTWRRSVRGRADPASSR